MTGVRFEWSPGRGDQRYAGNRSAFEVFIEYVGGRGRSFLGIEVKYHEDLTGTRVHSGARYPAIAHKHQVSPYLTDAEQGGQTPHRRRRRVPQPPTPCSASPSQPWSKPTTNGSPPTAATSLKPPWP